MATGIEIILSEMDGIVKLLEANLPANIERPENQKLIKGLEKDIAEYFRQIEMAIPESEIEALYYKRVKQE